MQIFLAVQLGIYGKIEETSKKTFWICPKSKHEVHLSQKLGPFSEIKLSILFKGF